MLTADFDFELPPELIAQEARERGTSRLLTLAADGTLEHRAFRDLPEILTPGDLLVVNNTRVLAARIFGTRSTGGRTELLLAERLGECEWDCLVKPGRKATPGTEISFEDGLTATVISRGADGRFRLRFSEPPERHLDRLGHVPLPPYIKRSDHPSDHARYQTVYATVSGAIAAPTAGLHFDRSSLEALRNRGIGIAELTLHVGIGTFKPVTADLVHEHVMDAERYELPEECATAVNETRKNGGRIVAVGTTAVRTLETVAAKHDGSVRPHTGSTDLFITPGYRFRAVDLLLTNFHLPRSTLLMLVSALSGRQRLLDAYAEAIRQRYRFYSYGDAMLVERRAS
jgi:S-adenosylmethionine:tRNA ribosyltransferase-isomerase